MNGEFDRYFVLFFLLFILVDLWLEIMEIGVGGWYIYWGRKDYSESCEE
jgi:hypothetical protein